MSGVNGIKKGVSDVWTSENLVWTEIIHILESSQKELRTQ